MFIIKTLGMEWRRGLAVWDEMRGRLSLVLALVLLWFWLLLRITIVIIISSSSSIITIIIVIINVIINVIIIRGPRRAEPRDLRRGPRGLRRIIGVQL